MRVLVIHAHPVPDSFNAALHACIVARLRAAGHAVDDCDLYAEGFQPVLSAAERTRYHHAGQNLAGIEPYVARLRAAEALVFCYPTWWFGMPAMLKGYFDRIWVPGVAFHMDPDGRGLRPRLRPGLTHVRKLAVVTTYGSPWWYVALYMRDPGRVVLTRGLRGLLAPGARITHLAQYDMDRATPARHARFLARVERAFDHF